eukprot:317066-Chlamydomonas_euryale.AAC.7
MPALQAWSVHTERSGPEGAHGRGESRPGENRSWANRHGESRPGENRPEEAGLHSCSHWLQDAAAVGIGCAGLLGTSTQARMARGSRQHLARGILPAHIACASRHDSVGVGVGGGVGGVGSGSGGGGVGSGGVGGVGIGSGLLLVVVLVLAMGWWWRWWWWWRPKALARSARDVQSRTLGTGKESLGVVQEEDKVSQSDKAVGQHHRQWWW